MKKMTAILVTLCMLAALLAAVMTLCFAAALTEPHFMMATR